MLATFSQIQSTERYSVSRNSIVIRKKGGPKITLRKVFNVANKIIANSVKAEIPTDMCSKAWEKVKLRFVHAQRKFNRKYNSIQKFLIKLWCFITRQDTLDRSFFLLSKNIIMMSSAWINYPHVGSDEEKITYIEKLKNLDINFLAAMVLLLSQKEKPKVALGLIDSYFENISESEASNYLLQSSKLHQISYRSSEVVKLLRAAHANLLTLTPAELKDILRNNWFAETLFVYAIDNGCLKFVNYLGNHMVNFEKDHFDADILGRYLYRAVHVRNLHIVKWAIKMGAQEVADINNKKPVDIARDNGDHLIEQYLLSNLNGNT